MLNSSSELVWAALYPEFIFSMCAPVRVPLSLYLPTGTVLLFDQGPRTMTSTKDPDYRGPRTMTRPSRVTRPHFSKEERADLMYIVAEYPDESAAIYRRRFGDMKQGKHKRRAGMYTDKQFKGPVDSAKRLLDGKPAAGSTATAVGGTPRTAASTAQREVRRAVTVAKKVQRRGDVQMASCVARQEVSSPVRRPMLPAHADTSPPSSSFSPLDGSVFAEGWLRNAGALATHVEACTPHPPLLTPPHPPHPQSHAVHWSPELRAIAAGGSFDSDNALCEASRALPSPVRRRRREWMGDDDESDVDEGADEDEGSDVDVDEFGMDEDDDDDEGGGEFGMDEDEDEDADDSCTVLQTPPLMVPPSARTGPGARVRVPRPQVDV